MGKKITQRNSLLELLRIFSMILIVHSHYSSSAESFQSLDFDLVNILHGSTTGNLGVVIFVVLTGYLTINSTFKVKKLVTLIAQVWFYSVSIYGICCLTGIEQFSLSGFVTAVFPLTFSLYWFCTAYVLLYLLTPFINKFLNSINQQTHLKLNILLFVIWGVIPTFTRQLLFCIGVVEFVMFYSFGAYLKKYPESIFKTKKNNIVILLSCGAILLLSVVAFLKLGEYYPALSQHRTLLLYRYSIFVIGFAVSLVSLFAKAKPFYNKAVNLFAGCVFSVYLIHDNSFFREYMWLDIFKTGENINELSSLLTELIAIGIIFAVSFVVENLRKLIIEKPMLIIYDKAYEKLQPKISAMLNKSSE